MKLEEKYEYNGWPGVARPDVKVPPGWSRALLTSVHRMRNHALSPDGETIAFIWDKDDQSDVYTIPARGGWPRRLTAERKPIAYWSDEAPCWSPDGSRLALTMNEHVYLIPSSGGVPQRISDFTDSAWGPVWLPDSRRLVVSVERADRTQLLLTDVDGAWPRPLVTNAAGDAWDPQPSPDGRLVAYTLRPFDDLNRLDIVVVDLESGEERRLTERPKTRNWHSRWSPAGDTLAYLSQEAGWTDIWFLDPQSGARRRVTALGHDVETFSWSPDGTRLALVINREGACDLALYDVTNSRISDLRRGLGYHSRPQWSPDGATLTVEYEDPLRPPDLLRVDVESRQVSALTDNLPPALAACDLVMTERVAYSSSDGMEIPAFLYRPHQPNGAAIVHPHGGPSSQYLFEWDLFAQYLVAKGYAILAPNYRGSTGYGVEFEQANYGDWGKGDVQDCLAGARYLHTLPGVDPQRIASYGASYGGYLTACVLARDPDYLFACGVDKFGDANLISSWAQCNRDLRLYSQIFLGHPASNRDTYVAGSPIYQVENVRRPLLILHGLDDTVVPPEASEEWVAALRRADKTFEYKTYAGEPHGFLKRATQQDAYARIERFLDWYLLPEPGGTY